VSSSMTREEIVEVATSCARRVLDALLAAELLELDPEVDPELLQAQLMERVLTTKQPGDLAWNFIKTLERSVFVEEIYGDNPTLVAVIKTALG
jgi:hypothetical protein